MATAASEMTARDSAVAARRFDTLALGAILLAATLVRAPWFGNPLGGYDEQLYSLIGQAMTQGQWPFVDLFDRKPPGLFALFAAAHAVGGPGPLAYQMLALAFTVAGGWLTMLLAKDLVDRVTAAGAGVLYTLLMALYGSQSGQSEAFHVPLMLGMALLVRDPGHPAAIRRAIWAMVLGGLALQIKYTVAPQCIAFGLWVLWHRYRLGVPPRKLVAYAALFAVLGILPSALAWLGYALVGHGEAFLFANVLSFFERAPSDGGRLHGALLAGLMPLLCLVGGGAYAALRFGRLPVARAYGFVALWFAASVATVFLPATVYAYYFAALVPSVVLLAVPLLDTRGPLRAAPLALIVAGALALQASPARLAEMRSERAAYEDFAATIATRRAEEGGCIWVYDGPASLYGLTGSCLPTRFIYPDHLNNLLERDALGVAPEREVERILATHPAVIVTADTALTPQNPATAARVRAALAADYRELARTRIGERNIRAWARSN